MNNKAQWISSTENNHWNNSDISFSTKENIKPDIIINENICYQTMDETPWGGCFADRGYMAMEKLTKEKKYKLINSLFGDEGLRLTTARLPLGNNDFSDTHKSYNEHTNDYSMEYFSLSSDEKYLLPYIKMALETRPNINFFATPWSPPSWMKHNNSIHGTGNNNKIIFQPLILKAYAKYFVKYIQEYEKQGIHINAITPQNEPTMDTLYASCVWTGEELNIFIRDYLYPALCTAGINNIELWLGTFTDSNAALVIPALEDTSTNKVIDAVCFQWWGSYLAKAVNKGYRKKIIQSETKCGNGNNDWNYAEEQFDCFKEFLEAGASRYYLWNMILDEKGANTAEPPWYQNAPIIIDSKTSEITFCPSYYLTKHFSYFIMGNAKRIDVQGSFQDVTVFKNPDGRIIIELKNSSDTSISPVISISGKILQPETSPHSINTFII